MKRVFVLTAPVQFTVGRPRVLIPAQQIDPPTDRLDAVECTQDDLASGGGNWGDAEIVQAATAGLTAQYSGDDVQVLTAETFDAFDEERRAVETAKALAALATPGVPTTVPDVAPGGAPN